MTTPASPYATPPLTSSGGLLEATLTTALGTIDSGPNTITNAETYNGSIPGPTLFLTVGDVVVIRLVNNLPYATGIHWHGIELTCSADGTPFTQGGVRGGPGTPPAIPQGGTYLYKFTVTRTGLFWYHPHHHHSTNRVFRGLYGMIVVSDEDEALLENGVVLPLPADTKQLVLSDMTVRGAAGLPYTVTYDSPALLGATDGAEWMSGQTSQGTPGLPPFGTPTPQILCEVAFDAAKDDGTPATVDYVAGEIPGINRVNAGRAVEGQMVLTNGVNVGLRYGTPLLVGGAGGTPGPQAFPGVNYKLLVTRGQGIRLQIVNCATKRYFRLILSNQNGVKQNLVRVGGEGGVLDDAVVEGGSSAGATAFNTLYESGEILLPPATRADVVAVIPDTETVGDVWTLWTRDYPRTGNGFSRIPTVPVMHLEIDALAPISPAYDLVDGDPLRSGIPGVNKTVGVLATPGVGITTLDPAGFGKDGMASPDIQLTTTGGGPASIDTEPGSTVFAGYYADAPTILSARYAKLGDIIQLQVTNTSSAHHPFHLHGFSFQPKSLAPVGVAPGNPGTYEWPYNEFRDTVNVPPNHILIFWVEVKDRKLNDNVTDGGALGRWLFHCHIFFHAHGGMISEFVVTDANGLGGEKPNVDVGGSWAYATPGGTAIRNGTFSHPDNLVVTLDAAGSVSGPNYGTLSYPALSSSGDWTWTLNGAAPTGTQYVYITATDSAGRKDQTVFFLEIGLNDNGSDIGDPHIYTMDGNRYDFQAVGEFTLLQDREGLDIQIRTTPVETAPPLTDFYTGLSSCVSVNTAIAALVGRHRISFQPLGGRGPREDGRLQFFIDGKPAKLTTDGIDLGSHRVSAFEVNGKTGLRIDYGHGAVVTASPRTFYSIWILDINVSQTNGDEGLMGRMPGDSWLPALPNGFAFGPMPTSQHDRYVTLYKTFADGWRVTDQTSMFQYAPGTSTATFTDQDWPPEKPPCILKPQFANPGAPKKPVNIDEKEAKKICKLVTEDDLHRDCVFDVATTGDKGFAQAYLAAQELRLCGTRVQIVGDKELTLYGDTLVVSAIVLPLHADGPTPRGHVTFFVDGDVAADEPVDLDKKGRARLKLSRLSAGLRTIRAEYCPHHGKKHCYHPSTSPNLLHKVLPPFHGANLRKLLKFFNAARSPEDLVATAKRQVALVDERQEHGIHLDEDRGDHADDAGHGLRAHLFHPELAKHILAERDKMSPVYGFVNIDALRKVDLITPELLDHIFPLFGPGVYGEWETLYGGAGTAFEVAHAAMLHNGQVLFIPESFSATDTLLWDPEDSNHATALRTLSGATTGLTGVLFCGAHSFLQDGKLLVVGGGTSSAGTTAAWKFDPVAETWQQTAGPMAAARWYPTTVALGEDSGRVLVANGRPASMEIYEESSDSFVPVHGPTGPADTAADRDFPELYPGLHLLPTGEIFFTRTGNNSGTDPAAYFTFSTPTSGSWTGLTGGSAGDDRGRGMSLSLLRQQPTDPDRILVIGGGNPTTQATVGLIDNPPSSAAWLTGSFPDGLPRSSVNGVVLPDGKILICGGRPNGGTPPNGGVCYLYDPSAGVGLGAFSEMDEVAYARQYHSVAVLLPSGKVMITGGSSQTIEVFSPPYLFTAAGTLASRPVIDSYPDPAGGTIILHGSTFQIGTAQAPDIAKVVLVRPMAVTHQTDAEQRVLSLSWSLTNPTTLSVTAPDGRVFPYAGGGGHTHVTAPRGYYMLFILNNDGVPSEAKFIRLV